jgi:hypothetical protein
MEEEVRETPGLGERVASNDAVARAEPLASHRFNGTRIEAKAEEGPNDPPLPLTFSKPVKDAEIEPPRLRWVGPGLIVEVRHNSHCRHIVAKSMHHLGDACRLEFNIIIQQQEEVPGGGLDCCLALSHCVRRGYDNALHEQPSGGPPRVGHDLGGPPIGAAVGYHDFGDPAGLRGDGAKQPHQRFRPPNCRDNGSDFVFHRLCRRPVTDIPVPTGPNRHCVPLGLSRRLSHDHCTPAAEYQ